MALALSPCIRPGSLPLRLRPLAQLEPLLARHYSDKTTITRLSSLVHLAQPSRPAPAPAAHPHAHDPLPPPLVLLLGWWRAHPSHLAKYAQLHLSRGSPVAYATLPPHCAVAPLFGLHRSLADLANGFDRALQLTLQVDSSSRNIVVHTLSNNGPFAWALLPSDLTGRVSKAIHDSGPSLLTPEQLVRGTVGVAWPGGPQNVPESVFKVARAYLQFPPHARILDELHKGLANIPQCPTLVLGGLRDSIVLPSEISEFVNKYRDPTLTRIEWMDAGHVQLLRKYPVEYAKLVNDFIAT